PHPDRPGHEGVAGRCAATARRAAGAATGDRRGRARVRRAGARRRPGRRPPGRHLPFPLSAGMSLAFQMRRLVRHSAVYGIGGLVSRILATILLPLYTHYLPPDAYGRVEIVTAATAVLAIVLQLGIASAFFRFYFDA